MIVHLARKELRQHRLLVGVNLGLFGSFLLLVILGESTQSRRGSPLELLFPVAIWIGVLAVVFSNALFTSELRQRTREFLDGLPVMRWQLLSIKLGLLLTMIWALALVSYGVLTYFQLRREPADLAFLAIVLCRVMVFSTFCCLLSAVACIAGRFQIPLYLAIFELLVVLVERYGLAGRDTIPFSLVLEEIAYERLPPVSALIQTSVATGALSVVFFVAVSVKDGIVPVVLASRMSHAEKVLVAGSLVAAIFVLFLWHERKPKEPYRLTSKRDSRVLERSAGGVAIRASMPSGLSDEQETLDRLHSEVLDLKTALDISLVPPIFVIHNSSLDSKRFEHGLLSQREGVIVRANLNLEGEAAGSSLGSEELEAYLISRTIIESSRRRLELESRRWVVDGLAQVWIDRNQGLGCLTDTRKERMLRRAVYARSKLGVVRLSEWLQVREALGSDLADALAGSVLWSLCSHAGRESSERFVKAMLAMDEPRDFRALWTGRGRTAEALLPINSGMSLERLLELWRSDLDEASLRIGEELSRIPKLEGGFEVHRDSAQSSRVLYRFRVHPPSERFALFSTVYASVSVFGSEIEPDDLLRDDHELGAAIEGELPRSFVPGSRVFAAIQRYVPELQCEVREAATRIDL
ncbi:MAG: hypothetical protein HY791_33015 [Deltaproteobacteria bacterium]|nr:hypothetical protein [Deltaproteobacteria bacterium]